MSLKSKILLGVATVFAGIAIHRRNAKANDVVNTPRLFRRRHHWREGLFFTGSGVVVGGIAVVTLASFKRRHVIAWLESGSAESIGATTSPVKERHPTLEDPHDGLNASSR